MDRWLARLSFSFFIIAALLVWQIYTSMTGRRPPLSEWRIVLYMIASVISITLGALGVRARHRLREDDASAEPSSTSEQDTARQEPRPPNSD